jgi:hypothetical protein
VFQILRMRNSVAAAEYAEAGVTTPPRSRIISQIPLDSM